MNEKIKKMLFSNLVLIILASLYVMYNIFAFFGEYLIGKIDIQWSLALRGSTVIIDIVLIVTGFFTLVQVRLRKRLKRLKVLEKERITVLLYIADTVAILCVFFFSYVVRLFVLLHFDKITTSGFWINSLLGILVVFLLAANFKKITRKIKKWGKRLKEKHGI